MLDKFDIQKLQELPIEQVAEALGLSVTRHRALCPFHDDSNPSLTFSVRKNRYKCYVCDAHGGVIDLVMHYEHKTFLEACRWLNNQYNVIMTCSLDHGANLEPRTLNLEPKPFNASRYERFFARPFLSNEARRFLFEERRLNQRVVQWCRLTSWKDKQSVPWLQIPYYDREGKLIGIQNRNLIKGGSPRFRFPSGACCSIYNLPVLSLLRPGETLFIAEGCSDCWSLLSAGHKAIAIPSATLLTKKDKDLLLSLSSSLSLKYAMYPDQDVPGERLFLQLQNVLPSLVRYDLPAGCKDFSDYYLQRLLEP
jgi:DNA primase